MRQSQLFTKTLREPPKDEEAANAKLLVQAGFIAKTTAGVYNYLPLGWRVLQKIIQIIREEMNTIGGQELFLSSLQLPEIWAKTGRWQDDAINVWFKTELKNGHALGLATTHEEPLTEIAARFVSSYKDLPFSVYQFQTKFRNELRVKSGILRTREFIMKDLYSFSRNESEHQEFWEKAKNAYWKIFDRLGIRDKTHFTFASGGTFSKYSHEFQTVCEAGEDTIYINKENNIAINKEVFTDDVKKDLGLSDNFIEKSAVEVGNIFTLGTRFSDALGLKYKNEAGEVVPVFMGSYGIGPGRVMGTIVEIYHDERGIIWPEELAPFRVHLIELKSKVKGPAYAKASAGRQTSKVHKIAEQLYEELLAKGVEVLYDDRGDKSPGEKFADADLIGIPWRAVVSEKTVAQNAVEVKKRDSNKTELVAESSLFKKLKIKMQKSK